MSAAAPTLFASAETARAVAGARAAVVLVGSYDGSGNYGDIAQLAAALDLVERLGPDVIALPVLEREYLASHRELAQEGGVDPRFALFFDPVGAAEDDLLPVAAPVELAFAGAYLYGGGYLNRSWGARKLAMLGAAEALLEAGGAAGIARVSSGLQVEADWIAELGERDAGPLRSFALHGARDPASATALAALDPATPVLAAGDDAVGILAALPPASAADPAAGPLRLNLHFAEHDWVVERPSAALAFHAGFLAELRRLAGRPLVAQPLIAYLDRRVDERPALERLRAACAAAGVELLEPLLLRPGGLEALAPRIGEASLTLSCSYHVALTSLMLGVPAVLLGDNPYYEQKAAGLAAEFGLPPAFAPAAGSDPAGAALEVAALVLDGERAAALRRQVAAGADRLRRRRADGATRVLAELAAASLTAFASRVGDLGERLRERSAEPARQEARLAALQAELEELRQRAGASPLEAELRAQRAEAELATVLGSRSWRLTAALRRLRPRRRR